MRGLGFSFGGEINFHNLFVDPIVHGHAFYYNLGSWFCAPLFMIQVFNVIIRKLLSIMRVEVKEWLIFGGYFVLGLIGIFIANSDVILAEYYLEKLVLTRFLCMLPIYEMGFLYKTKIEKWDSMSNGFYFSVVMISQLMIITFNDGPIEFILSGSTFPDNMLLVYAQVIVGIAFWLRIAKVFLPIVSGNKLINFIGSNTFSIMINHYLGIYLVKVIFAIIYIFTPFCNEFNIVELKNNYNYYYLPNDKQHWLLVYSVAGIIVPLLIQVCINRVKNMVRNFARTNGT